MAADLDLAQHAATVTLNLAVAVAVGAAMSAMWLASRSSAWAARQRRRVRLAGLAALGVALLADLAVLWLEAAAMEEVPVTEAADAAWSMLSATHLGMAWMAGAIALAAGTLAVALQRRAPAGPALPMLNLASLAAFLYTRSMVSHAAASGDFSVPMLADWIHLLLISVWVGEVVVAALVTLAQVPEDRADGVAHIEALSSSATWALAGLVATGLASAWFNLGSPRALIGNPYGTTLLAKLTLVGCAVLLGGYNRFMVMPALPAGPALRRFSRVLRVEALVLLGVLVLAAILSATSPPTAG